MSRARKTLLALGGILAIGLIVTAVAAFGAYRSAARGRPGGRPVKIFVAPGSSAPEITRLLEARRVIGSGSTFRWFLRAKGVGDELRAGEYELREAMPFDEVLAALRKGPEVAYVKLTIPEGLTLEQAATLVQQRTHISREDFLAAATPSTVRPAILPPGGTSLEGFLYPQTYFVIERESAQDLVRRMVSQFEKETASLDWDRGAEAGLSAYDILVIASLVEEEAKADEERPVISAVIHNRLRKKMRLEIDATVQYALKKYEGQTITLKDLEVDSPHNTYRIPGLPPTPISSPRASSIRAALQPADSDAIYYVLTPDCRRHFFTARYQEFLAAKARPRRCG